MKLKKSKVYYADLVLKHQIKVTILLHTGFYWC